MKLERKRACDLSEERCLWTDGEGEEGPYKLSCSSGQGAGHQAR